MKAEEVHTRVIGLIAQITSVVEVVRQCHPEDLPVRLGVFGVLERLELIRRFVEQHERQERYLMPVRELDAIRRAERVLVLLSCLDTLADGGISLHQLNALVEGVGTAKIKAA